MSEMSDASKPATYCYSPTNGIFEIFEDVLHILILACMEKAVTLQGVYMALWQKMVHIHLPTNAEYDGQRN